MLASRDFMTSVVVGKDAVPRIGMHQAETLRLLVMADHDWTFPSQRPKNGVV